MYHWFFPWRIERYHSRRLDYVSITNGRTEFVLVWSLSRQKQLDFLYKTHQFGDYFWYFYRTPKGHAAKRDKPSPDSPRYLASFIDRLVDDNSNRLATKKKKRKIRRKT